MQSLAQIPTLQEASQPGDLVWGLEERVIAVDGGVLSLDHILDLADRFGHNVADSLDMKWDEQEFLRINVPCVDEASGLLRATAGVVLVH
jgi:hypothetical protein